MMMITIYDRPKEDEQQHDPRKESGSCLSCCSSILSQSFVKVELQRAIPSCCSVEYRLTLTA